ncbi:MAG: alpha/beta fold hydrolase [Nakamurella sp.]
MSSTTDNPRQNITFASGGHTAHGYLALPPGGSGPGLIVIQEWWGLDSNLADYVDRFAAEGFVTLAPDLYGGSVSHEQSTAGALMQQLPVEQAARDLGGAVDFLLGHDAVTSDAVGAVGFCMGGGFVLLLAAREGDRVGAAVPFYGVGPAVPDSYTSLTAPVMGHYGQTDGMYPVADARELEKQIKAESGAQVEFHYYPAGHAFMNQDDHMGTYDADLAAVAWQRTIDFLHAKLG